MEVNGLTNCDGRVTSCNAGESNRTSTAVAAIATGRADSALGGIAEEVAIGDPNVGARQHAQSAPKSRSARTAPRTSAPPVAVLC